MRESEICPRCKEVIHKNRYAFEIDLKKWFDEKGFPDMLYDESTGIYRYRACFAEYKKHADGSLERI